MSEWRREWIEYLVRLLLRSHWDIARTEDEQSVSHTAIRTAFSPACSEEAVIVLASPSPHLLDLWSRAMQGFAPFLALDQADALRKSMLQHRPEIVLLDFGLPGLDSSRAIVQLRNLHPATGIVVLSGPISEETELELFKAGARGHCLRDIDPQLLKRVVIAIRVGELWIRRTLVPRLLDELGMRFTAGALPDRRASVGRLAYLTDREREIATLVGSGGSNKQIARQLDISERTVKAHLTEIFRKLGIADRLKLALLLAGNQSSSAAQSGSQT